MARAYSQIKRPHRVLFVDRRGDWQRGADIEALQSAVNRRLCARGLDRYRVEVDGRYTPATALACRKAIYALGAMLSTVRSDRLGVGAQRMIRHPASRVGAQLDRARARLERLRRRPLRERAWIEAGACLEIREVGRNRGDDVDRIVRYAQGQLGEPYCVDGVIWCYGHAGSQIVKPGYPRAVRHMLVPGVERVVAPKRGDIVRFSFDHTGLFGGWRCSVAGRWVACPRALATHILTREFNTSGAGVLSSDANDGTDGVHSKVRAIGLVTDYLRVTR